MGLECGTFGRLLGHKGKAFMIGLESFEEEKDQSSSSLPSQSAERARSPVGQALVVPIPWSCTSSLQNCEEQLLVAAVPGLCILLTS